MTDVAYPDLPDDILAAPTIGAWRRARGITGWDAWGRHAYAVVLADMAWRRAVLERLDGISRFVATGGPTDEAVNLLADLLDQIAPWLAEHLA